MKKIARLRIAYVNGQTDGDMKSALQGYMEKCGVSMADIEVRNPDAPQSPNNTHFGNWVLVPILDNEAAAKLAECMGTEIDMHRFRLEQSDLVGLKPGDKVTLQLTNMIACQHREEGRVHRVEPGYIEIIKKRSRGKGWRFNVGDDTGIWKGWDKKSEVTK